MAIREILVHLDPTPRAAIRCRLATELALRFNAQMVGLYVTHSRSPGPNEQRAAALMEDEFRRLLSQQGLDGAWQFIQDSPAETIIRFGRYADLSIIGQPDHQERQAGLSEKDFVDVLRGIGRPVLAVPYAGSFASVGKRVLVVWDGSSESTRAVNEALPLLCSAKTVQVIVSNSKGQHGFDVSEAGREIICHLARHGVAAEVERLSMDKGIEKGEALLSYAADFDADLMVVGAANSFRWRELMAGGGTIHTLIRKMTLPLLLSG